MELAGIILIGILILLYLLVKQRAEIKLLRNGLSRLFDQLDQLKGHIDEARLGSKTESTEVEKIPLPPEDIIKPFEETVDEERSPEIGVPPPLPVQQHSLESENILMTEEPTTVKDEPESWSARFRRNNPDIEKFIGENLINKIGIIILVLGISFFVKYAIDKEWINEPARVGIGILCGGILLAVAHRLRMTYKAFSSVLVAGAVAVFYFTIGIAFHDYQLFGQTTAFAIMVAITVFSVFVSILYDRQELAILSAIGGFAVPFMVSTGEGNYHVLFTYLAILNIGILSISYYKRWFIVNFVAFVLTAIVFAGWYINAEALSPLILRNALIYATIFYLIFSLAFVLNNIIEKNRFTNYEIAALVSNTAIYYAIGHEILYGIFPGQLGLYTIGLAFFNIAFAFIIYKKYQFDKNIIYVLIGLALTLATITIPVQFQGNYITVFWAAEAVLLFWLTKTSKLRGFTIAGIIVQVLSIISLFMDLNAYFYYQVPHVIFVNKVFVTVIVLIASLLSSYWLFKKHDYSYTLWGIRFNQVGYRKSIFGATLLFGYFLPLLEIAYQADYYFDNFGTICAFIYLYHMLYSTGLLLFNRRRKAKHSRWANFIGIFNIVCYILLAYRIPLWEKKEMIHTGLFGFPYAMALHYIAILCLLYQTWIFARNKAVNSQLSAFKKTYIPWFLAFFIVYLLSVEVNVAFLSAEYGLTEYYDTHNFVIKVIFPILWGVIAFGFLIFGIRRNAKVIRIIALTLLGLTIVKLFVYDIQDVSETGKIIAFILLGILILVISFVYQRIKKLIVEEHEDTL